MEKIARKWVNSVIVALLQTDSWKAEKYISEKLVIRATRRTYKYNNRKIRATDNIEILLVIGKPNFEHKETMKKFKKNMGSLPKGVILKGFPKTKKK